MALYPAYRWTWDGARVAGILQVWTLTLSLDAASAPVVVDLDCEGDLDVAFGDLAGDGYDARVLASSCKVLVYDTDDGDIAAAFDASSDENDFVVSLVGSDVGDGGFSWVGRVRLDLVDEPLFPVVAALPLELHLYDALAANKDRPALLNESATSFLALSDLLRYLTSAGPLGAAERHVVAFDAAHTPDADPVATRLRVRPLVFGAGSASPIVVDPFEDGDGVPFKADVQLHDLCNALDLRAWQEPTEARTGSAAGVVEPTFVVAHPWAVGDVVPSTDAARRPASGGLEPDPFDYAPVELTAHDFDGKGKKKRARPPAAVVVERVLRGNVRTGIDAAGSGQGGVTVDPGFAEFAANGRLSAWETITGSALQQAGFESGFSVRLSSRAVIRARGPVVAKGYAAGGYVRAFARPTDDDGENENLLYCTLELKPATGPRYYLRRELIYVEGEATPVGTRTVWSTAAPVDLGTFNEALPMRRSEGDTEADVVDGWAEYRTPDAQGLGGRLPVAGQLSVRIYGTDHKPRVDSAEYVPGEKALLTAWPRETDVATAERVVYLKHAVAGVGESPWQYESGGVWRDVDEWRDRTAPANTYRDLAELSARSSYEDRQPASPGARFVEVDAILTPARALILDGDEYRVGSGCVVRCLARTTTAVVVPRAKRYLPDEESLLDPLEL